MNWIFGFNYNSDTSINCPACGTQGLSAQALIANKKAETKERVSQMMTETQDLNQRLLNKDLDLMDQLVKKMTHDLPDKEKLQITEMHNRTPQTAIDVDGTRYLVFPHVAHGIPLPEELHKFSKKLNVCQPAFKESGSDRACDAFIAPFLDKIRNHWQADMATITQGPWAHPWRSSNKNFMSNTEERSIWLHLHSRKYID